MNLPAAQSGVQLLICSMPVANAAPEPQLSQCRSVSTSPASAQVKMKLEGRVCGLNAQLTTTVRAMGVRWTKAASVALAGGEADAQPVATTLSKMAISTETRFMVSSLAMSDLLT